MKSKQSTWRWVLVLNALFLGGCTPAVTPLADAPTATPTPPPTGTPIQATVKVTEPTVTATPTQIVVKAPQPAVAISPTSGPSGTLVQVVASGFPPHTPVTVGVGPENSEFGLAAQGTTDANGTFAARVPAEGAPGMHLVFAVAAEGQRGITAPDRFRITGAAPTVTISPTSGPPGTRVLVIANGFPPHASASAWVGPVNSEFALAAQGTTDANGSFSAWVPAEGSPGMQLVFAVSAEGQRGVWAPDQFHITSIGPTTTPWPSPTPHQDMWTTFSSRTYAVSLQYPADWQPVPGYGSPETDDTRFGAVNGFFQVNAMDSDSIDAAAAAEAGHKLQPYGSQPTIETLQVQGQEARLILPSADQPTGMQNQAALIIRYPQPVTITGTPCRFFVLWADWPHIRTIAKTLRFTN